jgi:DNA helicase HerA-like ATPase
VFGEQGHPVRATVSDMGPLLLARMLALNETQAGVLNLVFKIADDNGLLLLDLKDLRAMLQYVGDNAKPVHHRVRQHQRGQHRRHPARAAADRGTGRRPFFGEPMLDIGDFMQTVDGKGVINILAADKLMNAPRLYATFLLWMLSELFETLPEVGDLDKPKLVFFFDEAHLLFKDAPAALVERIELVVRLVRSKGVGVYFVTQNPLDVPDTVLAQLGNRVQHALRAFTPRDQKAVKAPPRPCAPTPGCDIATAITELAWARRWSASWTPRAGPASPSASSCCRRAARSARSRRAAQGADRRLAGGRRVREDGGPRIGLREAQGPKVRLSLWGAPTPARQPR